MKNLNRIGLKNCPSINDMNKSMERIMIKNALIMILIALILIAIIIELVLPSQNYTGENLIGIIDENKLVFLIGFLTMIIVSIILIKKGINKVEYRKREIELLAGTIGMKVFIYSLIVGSSINFISEIINMQKELTVNMFFDYWLNPFITILIFGIGPAILLSYLYGRILIYRLDESILIK